MSTTKELSKDPRYRHRRSEPTAGSVSFLRIAARLIGTGALILACALIVMYEVQYRIVEASVASWWMNGIIVGGARPMQEYIMIHLPASADQVSAGLDLIALHITVECSSYVVLIPLLLLSGFLLGATKVSWVRWFLGTLVGCIGLFIVNQLRIAVIAYSTNTWGMRPGFEISHILVGSIVGLCGFIACFFLALRIMNPKRNTRRPSSAA